MRATLIAGFMVAMALAACVRQPADIVQEAIRSSNVQTVRMQTKFDYDVHKPYTATGPNTINGQGFLRQQGGGVVTCAGREVLLVPATPFFREAIDHVRAGRKPQIDDPTYRMIRMQLLKTSQCDARGTFVFSNLPDGSWFVMTAVMWMVGYDLQGGPLMQEFRVANGETAQVLLTEKDFMGDHSLWPFRLF